MTSSYLAAEPTYKKPGETLNLEVDFTLYGLKSGEMLTTPTAASGAGLTVGTPVINVATFINRKGGVAAIGKGVQVSVAGGTAGTDYNVDITASTSGGQVLVGRCPVFVRDG